MKMMGFYDLHPDIPILVPSPALQREVTVLAPCLPNKSFATVWNDR